MSDVRKRGHKGPKGPKGQYTVGYGKPPEHGRFQPGRSGNPRGRPKGVRNFIKDLRSTLEGPVKLMRDGKLREVSTQEAALLVLAEKALARDGRALDGLIALARTYNTDDEDAAVALSANDAQLVEVFKQRVLSGAVKRDPPTSNSDRSNGDTPADKAKAPDGAGDQKPVTRRRLRRRPVSGKSHK